MITKIIDAMFCGCPVITTHIGNEGIEGEHGKHLFLAETPAEFIDRINILFRNENLRKTIADNAEQFVLDRYQFDNVINLLEKYYFDLQI